MKTATTTAATTTAAAEIARTFVAQAREYGFSIRLRGSIVTIAAQFTPGDGRAYAGFDMGSGCLYGLPKTGSIWGTDGASIGGAIGCDRGEFEMHASGVRARVIAAIAKAIA